MIFISDFNDLTEAELQQFATDLLKDINASQVFASETDRALLLDEKEPLEFNDLTGELYIPIVHADYIEVPRKATWASLSEDDIYDPAGATFEDPIQYDIQKCYKTLSSKIGNYNITLRIDDYDEADIVDVEVDSHRDEDAGIGEYEYWGHKEYDSRPYIEVEGTLFQNCYCYLTLIVEPIN